MFALRQINKSFSCQNENITKKLYTSLIRPIIEYANTVWHPTKKSDQQLLEKVQHIATKRGNLKNLSYNDRLKALDLPFLDERRKRGDLIQMHKHFSEKTKINWINKIIINKRYETRSNTLRYSSENASHHTPNPRHNFLPNRIADVWSTLPQDVVNSATTNIFKNRYDEYIKNRDIYYKPEYSDKRNNIGIATKKII